MGARLTDLFVGALTSRAIQFLGFWMGASTDLHDEVGDGVSIFWDDVGDMREPHRPGTFSRPNFVGRNDIRNAASIHANPFATLFADLILFA
jgi:hypothetical protein